MKNIKFDHLDKLMNYIFFGHRKEPPQTNNTGSHLHSPGEINIFYSSVRRFHHSRNRHLSTIMSVNKKKLKLIDDRSRCHFSSLLLITTDTHISFSVLCIVATAWNSASSCHIPNSDNRCNDRKPLTPGITT